MYKWYRPASGANGPSTEILPCHEVALPLPLRCSATVVLFGLTEVIGLLEIAGVGGRNDKQHSVSLELTIMQAPDVVALLQFGLGEEIMNPKSGK
jgi:hypothetical protein